MEKWSREKFLELCPWLHIEDSSFQSKAVEQVEQKKKPEWTSEKKSDLTTLGFAKVETPDWNTDIAGLLKAAKQLHSAGLPASLICVFDEVWALQLEASRWMQQVSGGNVPVMDTLCFFVDANVGASGFSVHRDRVPCDWTCRGFDADVSKTFRKDGSAKYCTLWIALDDVTTQNSCLYFLPRDQDPGYMEDDPEDDDDEKEMEGDEEGVVRRRERLGAAVREIFRDQSVLQYVTATPLQAGQATIHTHRTLHWGSAVQKGYKGASRVSLSFSFSDPEFEPPYLIRGDKFPPFHVRKALGCAQVLNYSSLAQADAQGWKAVSAPQLSVRDLHACFKANAAHFDPTYQAEIAAKFFAAVQKRPRPTEEAERASMRKRVPSTSSTSSSCSSGIDDALEAMLDAEAAHGGKACFHDDYDVANADSDMERGQSP